MAVRRALVGLALILSGCGSTPSSPAPASPPAVSTPPPTVTSVVLTSSLPMGTLLRVASGTDVTFNASASGGAPPVEFRFKGNGFVLRGWSTSSSFTWDTRTDADGVSRVFGRVYFWVEARSGGRADAERSSDVFQFDVLDCAGLDRFTPTCAAPR